MKIFAHFFLIAFVLHFSNFSFCQDIFKDEFELPSLDTTRWHPHTNIEGIDGIIELGNNYGKDGTGGVIIGKETDNTGFTTNVLDLNLEGFSLDTFENVEMTFYIKGNFDNTDGDSILLSFDGGNEFPVGIELIPDDWCSGVFGKFPPIDLKNLAETEGFSLNNSCVIRFKQRGLFNFGGGQNDRNGFYLDNVCIRNPILIYESIPFHDDFEDNIFKKPWAQNFADNTTFSNPTMDAVTTPMNIIEIQDNIGINSTKGVAIGRHCDGSFSTNALDLHLNLLGETDVELTFWIQDNYDDNHPEDGLFFSDDGGQNFIKVLDFVPEEWCDQKYGKHPPIDVDYLAGIYGLGLSSQFVIRFQQRGKDDFGGGQNDRDGFYLDEVIVRNGGLNEIEHLTYHTLPFSDNFNNGIFKSAWAQNFADSTNIENPTGAAITTPMNIIEIQDNIGINSTKGVAIGRHCDGSFSTNALDLHLNLLGETDVELTFWIQDNYDDNHPEDGLFFSDDGGQNFIKVLDFVPEEWCDQQYGKHPPIDVDYLADIYGLGLSSQFVIRFQQRGKDDFGGGQNDRDGFILDDVEVYDPGLVYATVDFTDDFEDGIFKKSWAQNFADSTTTDNPTMNDVTTPMNYIEIEDGIGLNGSRGVRIGRRCNGNGVFTSNALDLHLNLENTTDIVLTYWMRSLNDEIGPDDGIYFSNNDEENFEKIYDFNFLNTNLEEFTLNISDLTAQTFTANSIIRFQQRGEESALNSSDGIVLDNVNVSGIITNVSSPIVDQLQIYPNPTNGELIIDSYYPENIVTQIRIFDSFGRNVMNSKNDEIQKIFNVENLISGFYLIELQLMDGSKVLKRIVRI